MNKFLMTVLVAVCLSVLTACATPVNHATPSGKVEATFSGVKKSTIKDAITNEMINRGYNVGRSDDSVISFDRPVDNPLAAMAFGSGYDSTPSARITYNLVQSNKGLRVVADCAIITNPGSAFERRNDMNNNADTLSVQKMLDDLQRKYSKK